MRHVLPYTLLLLLGFGGSSVRAPLGEAAGAIVESDAWQRVNRDGRVRVLAELRLPGGLPTAEGSLSTAGVSVQRRDIVTARRQVLARLSGRVHRVLHEYETIPFVALEVEGDALAILEATPFLVRRVVTDALHAPALVQSTPITGADQAWTRGFDGTGTVVAILDLGVEATHPFLMGKVVEEACYSSTTSISTTVCPNGQNAQTGVGAGAACSLGACWHGTHVAGIAAGNGAGAGVAFSGVAKGAQIMAVQVFSRFDNAADCGGSGPCMQAWTSDIIAGLERVYALRGSRNVVAANLSLGGGGYSTSCDSHPTKPIIDNLRSAGIATVVAAGNNGGTNRLNVPACVSSSISVGATTKADAVASFSNVSPLMSLFAPGESINSSMNDGGFGFGNGTSMAAPHVTAAWAILKQAVPGASVDTILSALRSTGVPIADARAGGSVTQARIQVDRSLSTFIPTVRSVTPSGGAPGATVSVTVMGTGFAVGDILGFGAGIGVSNVQVVSSEQLSATLAIGATAAPGARDVTVQHPGGSVARLAGGFTVGSALSTQMINVAASANGGIASASSTYSSGFPPAGANDGDRKGTNWARGGGWNDATSGVLPDWLQITFNGAKTISLIDVFTVQDSYGAPSEPTTTMRFGLYGITDFDVQYWTGSAWAPIPGGTVTGNSNVWRRFDFAPLTTDRIRVLVKGALAGYSRIAEVEAWSSGSPSGPPAANLVNVAAQTNGGVAAASTTYSNRYPAEAANDGERRGINWGNGGGWNDATAGVLPDRLEVAFNGLKTISEIDVYTLQDDYTAPRTPTLDMTFSLYGITDFHVQYWTGAAWATIPGGDIRANTNVWRRLVFAPLITDRVRVVVTGALQSYSRIVEIEAWGE